MPDSRGPRRGGLELRDVPERKSDKELLADLLAKGYGEDEKRKRRERAAAAHRRGALREKRKGVTGSGHELRHRPVEEPEAAADNRRIEDTVAAPPPVLRRRIDNYAWRGGFLATGIPNHRFGWGRVDALAAVQSAAAMVGTVFAHGFEPVP